MSPYDLLVPQLLAGGVIVYFSLRAVRRSTRETAEHEKRLAVRLAEDNRYLLELKSATVSADRADLVVNLDLLDEETTPDLLVMAERAGSLVTELSRHERSLGGLGLTLTQAKVQPGGVRLTLSPVERLGSAERVRRVVDEWNAAATPLPPGVCAAHADILVA